MVALVIQLVQLLGQALGIVEAEDAGAALADDDGPHLGAGAAGDHPFLGQKGLELRNLLIGDAGKLQRHAGGEGHRAVSELFSGLPCADHLPGGEGAVFGDDSPVEALGPPVEKKPLSFYSFDVFRF